MVFVCLLYKVGVSSYAAVPSLVSFAGSVVLPFCKCVNGVSGAVSGVAAVRCMWWTQRLLIVLVAARWW